jgi:GNAT superfamily N-acetyltransferase
MAPGGLLIRGARAEELDRISKLLVRAYTEYADGFPWPDAWSDYLSDVADVHGRWGRSKLWVAELDGSVVGSVDYYPPDSGGYDYPGGAFPRRWACFRCLGTDPDRRGIGVGRALVEHLVALARREGASHLGLHSAPLMAAAVRMYQAMGFEHVPEHDFWPRPGSQYAVLAFGLPLLRLSP